MDVVCGRCKAEYEFDDALISERGTTVRCTNCGLQFKVFPRVGRRAPEVWRVFHPDENGAEPVHYESLSQLQKAIAQGAVTAAHRLSRGDESPRALAEIVELQPLLRQPRSEPPPSMRPSEAPAPQSPAEASPARERSGTVLGMELRPDPAALSAGSEEEEVVPGTPEPPEPEPAPARTGPSSHPKIRSALSLAPLEDSPPPSSGKEGRKSIVPRTSLRSTLSGNYSTPPSSTRSSFPASPAVAPLGDSPSSSAPPAAEEAAAANEVPALPRVEEALAPDLPFSDEEIAPAPPSAPPSTSSEPEISEAQESIPGQMTPTPSGLRAYQTVDSVPVSARAGVPAPRRARSVWIVLVVLGGGALFYGISNQDKLSGMLGPQEVQEGAAPSVLSDAATKKLDALEVQWVKKTLFDLGDEPLDFASLGADQQVLEAENSWSAAKLLRMQGKLEQARQMQSALPDDEQALLARALLDLAESPDDPPWPSIQSRLKEASIGERSPYLARVVLIYSLASAGQVKRAQAQFDSLSRATGAKESPLFEPLEAMLSALTELEQTEPDPPALLGDEADKEGSTAQEEAAAIDVAVEAEGAESGSEAPAAAAQSPEPVAEKESAPTAAPRAPKVSDEVKAQVSQADALWRGGNRDGALALYRQVVAKIGTSHFLGQRSAARIRQAEREKAESK